MKFFSFITLAFFFLFSAVYSEFDNDVEDEYIYASEIYTSSGSTVIVPEDINWTQRFILTELKELRVDLERLRRELNEDLNARELATVDRALSYSGNTVNFLWLIITMAVTGFGLVGWRTMKDVRENLTNNYEKEVQKRVKEEQKKLEAFMKKFEKDQLEQSESILKNQELIRKKQETGYIWSQYNREENHAQKLELLEKISTIGFEEDAILIYIEKSNIYTELALWDKALEFSDMGLSISNDNISLLYNKAKALMMLEKKDEAIKVLINILGVNPVMKEDILADSMFLDIVGELEEYIANQEKN